MKKLCVAVMLIISGTGISQVIMTEYDNKHNVLDEQSFINIEASYTEIGNKFVLNAKDFIFNTVSIVAYNLLEVTQSTDNLGWVCYKCVDTATNTLVNFTIFHDGPETMIVWSPESDGYKLLQGEGLKFK
tara:strand:+ start:1123 stop:1512 length:390 start_codon:yes stop_codon:yes gene_type:complete